MNWKVLVFLMAVRLPLIGMPLAEGVEFLNLRLPEALQQASKVNKPLMVHFTASWCMPCRWMETNTFMDPEVVAFTKQNYLAVKVDFDDMEGARQVDLYSVKTLPTLLILNPDGRVAARQEYSISAERLLTILKRFYVPAAVSSSSGSLPGMKVPVPEIVLPPIRTEDAPSSSFETPRGGKEGEGTDIRDLSRATPSPSRTTYFSIQMGAYKDSQLANQLVKEIKEKYQLPVSILEETLPGKPKYFKVHLGEFYNKPEATAFLARIAKEGRQGFVVELNKF
jgi:thiol-disulfide isomerase/thioredoxin